MTIEDIYQSVGENGIIWVQDDYVMCEEDGRIRTICHLDQIFKGTLDFSKLK